jgi:predicted RNA-binding protein YlqC (UPF0109 family)
MEQKEIEVEYLLKILRPLVTCPDELSVNKITDERGVLLTVLVSDIDAPVIIGKQGQFAKALRTILRTYGSKIDALLHIKIESTRDRLVT